MFKDLLSYFKFLKSVFQYNTKYSILFTQILDECIRLGVSSILFFIFLSFMVGAVCGIHLTSMLKGMLFAEKIIPVGLKNIFFLEFSPAMMCIVFIGKNITAIAGQLFFLKTSGHFDNLKVVGIRTASYICLPKIIATTIVYPLLTILSCFFSLLGGFLFCVCINNMNAIAFISAYVSVYNFKYLILCIIKSIVFGFVCGSVSSYIGYNYDTTKNEDLITISQKCFTCCCLFVLGCDVILNFINYCLTK